MHVRKTERGWRVIVQHNGLKRSATARTKAEVLRKGAELLIAMGDTRPASTVTVAEMFTSWLALTADTHKPTYHVDVERVVARLPETFASRRVAEVQPLLVEMLYRELVRDGWTTHRIHRLHQAMSTAWTMVAIPYGYATSNPVSAIRPPTRPPAKPSAPTVEQVRDIYKAATGQIGLFIDLAARTGARRGELVGLQWGDLRGVQLIIRRSVATLPGRPLIIGNTKTGEKGQRVVALDPITANRLRDHRLEQESKLAAAGYPSGPVWVFSHDAGVNPWRTDYISREFANVCELAGVTGVRLHDLRHFHATQLLAAGAAVSTVAHRMGYSTPATLLKTYSHAVQATDQAAAATMDGVLRPPT